jgi:hypothetical protein
MVSEVSAKKVTRKPSTKTDQTTPSLSGGDILSQVAAYIKAGAEGVKKDAEKKAARTAFEAEKKIAVMVESDTSVAEFFSRIGVKQVGTPSKMLKRHISSSEVEFTPERTRLLMAIIRDSNGEYTTIVSDDNKLKSAKSGPYSATFYELSHKQAAEYARFRESLVPHEV